MYHDLPRAARFWSVLRAIDQDLAEKPARKHVPVADVCTPPTTSGNHAALPPSYPSKSASD